jgi:hypothetical protein
MLGTMHDATDFEHCATQAAAMLVLYGEGLPVVWHCSPVHSQLAGQALVLMLFPTH